ncbi:LEA type 2 family protein [Pseudomonas coleopterorum]|uniref:LEA type 2 family protein n=1 Tax=Pseudomonas coleopterorum TaxID=1605838 RepID=A0AAJ6M2C6_9PSED|nr:LEA type 2 family protein [Pseudomonas coleopterorum]WNC11025.1 LEA type 2 family protein [Pseudomonas coleopterorum]SEE54590.1 LEA14-like dessication related protein [Pseudomonas coleopterorum]
MSACTLVLRSIGLLSVLALTGCATWFTGNYEDPKVHLVKVEVVKANLLQQRFILRFRIDNPNRRSLPVRGMSYSVRLEDMLLSEGETSDWFSVAGRSGEYYEVPVRTNLWQHVRELSKLLKHPDRPIRYELRGELRTGVLFGHDVVLNHTGEINARGLPGH